MKKFALFATLLTLLVVGVGAFTRLSDAGLGCPDWPGCYGAWKVPSEALMSHSLQKQYPDAPFDRKKAHIEMGHRYLAGILALTVAGMCAASWIQRRPLRWMITGILSLIIIQAAFGMWTVTLRLAPIIVLTHLLLGLATLSSLWWFYLQNTQRSQFQWNMPLLALIILILQIFLGGWTSTNYAALACSDFPTCQGMLIPPLHFEKAFHFLGGLHYENPLTFMDYSGRVTIHMFHRFGAILATLTIGWLIVRLLEKKRFGIGLLVTSLLAIQVVLGIANVLGSLPLNVAVLHNVVAALLLLTLLYVCHQWPFWKTPCHCPHH